MVDASVNFKGGFAVRPVYPLWTNRRLVNGVVEEGEDLSPDTKLEIVIEGVMDDLKVWAESEEIIYDSWLDLDTVPRAIKRATTYYTVAALYSRRTKTFQSRVIPVVAPVSVTVMGEAEKAMNHWEDRGQKMLDLYLAASGQNRLWVSTADEEAIFSMDDIVPIGDRIDSATDLEEITEYG